MTKIQPLGPRLVVKVSEHADKTPGGLVLPDKYRATQEQHHTGVVKAVGDGWYAANGALVPLRSKVGDTVMFRGNIGDAMTVDGEKLLVLHEDHVVAKIEVE